MTSPDNFTPPNAYGPSTVHGLQDVTQAIAASAQHADIAAMLDELFDAFFDNLLGGFGGIAEMILSFIGDLIGDLVQGIFGIAGGVGSLISGLLGVRQKSDLNSSQIIAMNSAQAQANTRLTKLEDITGTGIITPIWSSVGGKDLVTFPKTMMQPVPSITSTEDGGDGDGSGGQNGRHSHTVTMTPPAFTQGSGFVDMAFIRGGVDRPVIPKVVKIITGADTGFFDMNAWYLGLYVYNPVNGYFSKIWDSGNRVGVLSAQRQAYNFSTGLTNTFIQPDHLIGVASLQIATGIGRSPRGLGCIFQTGISEATGTTPFSPHAFFSGQTTLPDAVFRSNMTYSKTKIMWAAVGESS